MFLAIGANGRDDENTAAALCDVLGDRNAALHGHRCLCGFSQHIG